MADENKPVYRRRWPRTDGVDCAPARLIGAMSLPRPRVCVVIRAPSPADGEGVVKLLGELGYAWTASEMQSFLSEPRALNLRLARKGDVLRGFIAFEDSYYFPGNSTLCRITALVVPPAARRRGVARLLVDAVLCEARGRGCSAVEVTTAVSRADAHGFYESVGFERTSYRYYRSLADDGEPDGGG